MSTIRAAGLGTLTASNTATIVDPSTPAGGIARVGTLVSYSAVASTSGTAIDFTGIPSWARKISIVVNAVSTNGTSGMLIQIGSGSYTTSGYVSHLGAINGGTGQLKYTNGFGLDQGRGSAAVVTNGVLTLYNVSGNIWVASGTTYYTNNDGAMCMIAGNVTLAGTLDRVRITTTGGSDTFDAGSVNVMYE
jgi:hypothetical protein